MRRRRPARTPLHLRDHRSKTPLSKVLTQTTSTIDTLIDTTLAKQRWSAKMFSGVAGRKPPRRMGLGCWRVLGLEAHGPAGRIHVAKFARVAAA